MQHIKEFREYIKSLIDRGVVGSDFFMSLNSYIRRDARILYELYSMVDLPIVAGVGMAEALEDVGIPVAVVLRGDFNLNVLDLDSYSDVIDGNSFVYVCDTVGGVDCHDIVKKSIESLGGSLDTIISAYSNSSYRHVSSLVEGVGLC